MSVIIPALNEEKTIRECLSSLLKMDYPPERREILVVDNGSTDRTAEIVKSFPVRYIREERRGASSARNKGIEAGKGEILAFTDADCIVSRGWLWELVRAFDEEGVGGVAGEIVAYPPKTPAEWYAARVRHLSPRKYLSRPLLPFAVFANLAFRRDVFDKIGLLDETILEGEATDFCTRFFRGTGLKLEYALKAIVFHRHRATAWEFFRQQWNYGKGHAKLYIKYRQEIPWGWRKSFLAYRELARAAWGLAKSVLRYGFKGDREDFYFYYFEFLKKLAERLGFIRQSISQGYLYF
ncbi:glycosyltransferase [Nitrospinae bacterium AH-259-F20]|nr:glycosyltransferase [Nitrospinae bacterium AH-259-F20]